MNNWRHIFFNNITFIEEKTPRLVLTGLEEEANIYIKIWKTKLVVRVTKSEVMIGYTNSKTEYF